MYSRVPGENEISFMRLYHYYEVPAKETVYSLCYKLDITKDEMIRHNPSVADGLRSGMKIGRAHV